MDLSKMLLTSPRGVEGDFVAGVLKGGVSDLEFFQTLGLLAFANVVNGVADAWDLSEGRGPCRP